MSKGVYQGVGARARMLASMEKLPLRELQGTKAAFEQVMSEADAAHEPAEEAIEAIEFLTGEDKKLHTKDLGQRRYQASKISACLIRGALGRMFAKLVAARVHACMKGEPVEQPEFLASVPGGEFDRMLVTRLDDSVDGSPGKAMTTARAALLENCTAKGTDMVKTMVKKGWKSSMHKVEHAPADGDFSYKLGGNADEMMKDAGATPFLAGVKAHQARFGAADFSMPGLGCLVVSMSEGMVMNVYKAEAALKQGIGLKDVPAYIETASGHQWAKENTVTVIFHKVGEVVWVPHGCIASLLYVPHKATSKKDQFGFALLVSHWSTEWALEIDSSARSAICTLNKEQMDKNKDTKAYQARAKLADRFFGAAISEQRAIG